MDKLQIQVAEFHKATNTVIPTEIGFNNLELRKTLIKEEFKELMEALDKEDFLGAISEMVDLKYVIDGAALAFGIDLEPFQDAIHAANMAKVSGPVREDGKQLKPEGWKKADLASILESLKITKKDKLKFINNFTYYYDKYIENYSIISNYSCNITTKEGIKFTDFVEEIDLVKLKQIASIEVFDGYEPNTDSENALIVLGER